MYIYIHYIIYTHLSHIYIYIIYTYIYISHIYTSHVDTYLFSIHTQIFTLKILFLATGLTVLCHPGAAYNILRLISCQKAFKTITKYILDSPSR